MKLALFLSQILMFLMINLSYSQATERCKVIIQKETPPVANNLEQHFMRIQDRTVIEQEFDKMSADIPSILTELFHKKSIQTNPIPEDVLEQALHLIVGNVYLEYTVPYFIWNNFLNDLNPSSLSSSDLRTKMIDLILSRRALYVEKNKLNPDYMSAEPMKFDLRSFTTWNNAFVSSPVKTTTQKLISEMPRIDRAWPRQFDRTKLKKPKVLLFDLTDIPGTRVVIFDDILFMNDVFYRASHYTEMEKKVLSGLDLFGLRAGGHDLKGTDLLIYYEIMKAHYYDNRKALSDPEYQRRLSFEKEFFEREIIPFIKERGAENVVYIAAPSDTASDRVVSHEVLHARYFLDPSYQKIVYHFYHEVLTPSDRAMFENSVEWVGYNLKDPDLMANEFQAHMYEKSLVVANDTKESHEIARVRGLLETKLTQYLKSKNFSF